MVQGVGYRYFVARAAERHGIFGYARNLFDGRVEVVCEGIQSALDAFRQELERGPAASRVDVVTESEPAGEETFTAFTIRG